MKFNNSLSAFEEAYKVIPGGVDSPVRAFKSVGGTPPFIAKGEGGYIFDIDGNRYIDFVQSWGPLIFGHADKDIENAVIEAVKNGLSFGAPTLSETALAKEVVELFEGIDKIRFVSSGTEALCQRFVWQEDIPKKMILSNLQVVIMVIVIHFWFKQVVEWQLLAHPLALVFQLI